MVIDKLKLDPILEALNDLPVESTSSRHFQLQSHLLDLNTEYSNLGNDLQKQHEIEKNARQKQLIIEARRTAVRESINRLEKEMKGVPASTIHEGNWPDRDVFSQRIIDLASSSAKNSRPTSPAIFLPKATAPILQQENNSAGNSEIEEEVETGIAPRISDPIPATKNSTRGRPPKRAAETITSNTRAFDPSTVLPRGASQSPSPKRPALRRSTNDISFSSASTPFKIFTDERRQILKDYGFSKIGKTSFKPRSLVLYPSCFKSRHSVIGMTPYSRSGEGIQLWNLEKKARLQAISAAELQIPQGYCEEVEWIERDCIAIASVYKNENPAKYQLGLLRDCRMNSKTDAFEYDFLPLRTMPHQKGITSIIPVLSEQFYSPVQFATGGLDHKVVIWSTDDITRPDPKFKTTQLKPVHTSAISALLYNHTKNVLYSGGKDNKLYGMDLQTQQVVFGNPDMRYSSHIQELMNIAHHPDLLLAG